MVVDQVGPDTLDRRGSDQLQFGVLRLDRFVELRVAAVVAARFVELVLVADFDISELEGLRMAALGAEAAPPGVNAAGHIFQLVQSVLHVGLESGAGFHMILSQRIAAIDS
jgi:hypothetical protein